MAVSGYRHAPTTLLPGMTPYPLYRKMLGSHGRSERVR